MSFLLLNVAKPRLEWQVEEIERDVVLPFMAQHRGHFHFPGAVRDAAVHTLYRWATAMVAAYSFELGDDKYQVQLRAAACVHAVSTLSSSARPWTTCLLG